MLNSLPVLERKSVRMWMGSEGRAESESLVLGQDRTVAEQDARKETNETSTIDKPIVRPAS